MEIDFNALGQAVDTSWGRASTTNIATHSVKFSIQGDRLTAKFVSFVTFSSERDMLLTKRASAEEANYYVSANIKNVKEKYKEITGNSLKLTKESESDSVEFVSMNPRNPKRNAYYKKFVTYSIS